MDKIRKTEFWLATAIYLLVIFAMIFPTLFNEGAGYGYYLADRFEKNHMAYDGFLHYLMPRMLIATVSYVTFVAINNWLIPYFFERKNALWGAIFTAATMFFFWGMLTIAFTWRYGYMLGYRSLGSFYNICCWRAFIIVFTSALGYVAYHLLKATYFGFVHRMLVEKKIWKKVPLDIMLLVIVWALSAFIMVADSRPARFHIVLWGGMAYIVAYMAYCRYIFLPLFRKEQTFKKLVPVLLLILTLSSIFACLLIDGFTRIGQMGAIYALVVFCNVMFMLPLAAWVSYNRLSRKNEVLNLEKALGRSSANLDFLRSQINPHFLFNALNTLYGTALQENAPRTSEGVQKLGDMMRFMLHENNQEKIELDKEVGYLQNYIALQKLRTQQSPDIKIEVNINDADCTHDIAPMLLIPFVENAFKHGISLRNRSWIVVSLSCDENHIYFDAYNSIHVKPDNDPEKHSLGIGLNNVRRRLQLLYPNRHELSIRQTATEFFVHLTITTK
ncbi:sensor histidine kinase [Chitinophaga sp. GCM10012297]|uniref:Histidine kinase n=1 Tax=Chitinophaga chungangae TaxID=2821488 RepID=A0ABS3YKL2_9BACT|nr:histidine kinase [Chitinophaga chungangae]MBO9155226.1 histidine kinase [Chitinophaga chungangae]